MQTNEAAGEFFSTCEAARSAGEVETAFHAAATRAGFNHSSYVCGSRSVLAPTTLLLCNYPAEWRRHYRERDYERLDPILARSQSAIVPFLWGEPKVRASMSPKQALFMNEARTFHLAEGYVVPLHASMHWRAVCTFVSDHRDVDPAACVTMRRISIITHEHLSRLTRINDGCFQTAYLSEREATCLSLFADGLNDAEIAAHLGIRTATVRRHFELARRRLKVATRPQALVRALATRQIPPH